MSTNGYAVQSSVIERMPDERLAGITRIEFKVLCDGERNDFRGWRDLCIGSCVSASTALAGLFFSVDWPKAIKDGAVFPFAVTGLEAVLTLASAFGIYICHSVYKATRGVSAYAAVMNRLSEHFTEGVAES